MSDPQVSSSNEEPQQPTFQIYHLQNNIVLKQNLQTNELSFQTITASNNEPLNEENWTILAAIHLTTKETKQTRPNWKRIIIEIMKILALYYMVVVVIFIGAVPIWGIERTNEKHQTGKVTEWTYMRSVYFTTVSVLTIGYGDMAPQTKGGKIFMMFYLVLGIGTIAALIGTIATTVMFTSKTILVGILRSINHVISLFWTKVLRRQRKIRPIPVKFFSRSIFALLYLVIVMIGYLLFGALIYWLIEDWSYFNSFWFTFVTLTT
jgi:hypothetical protein